tara:strand:- start:1941 stop:2567 length:627 start_codon:yes stop_codon:yes gene_type:complete
MRVFSNGPNNMRSSSDHINRKRAEITYKVATSNISTTQPYNNNSNVPVKAGPPGPKNTQQLSSVGGYNVKSYDLLLDLTKGKFYNATSGRYITLLPSNANPPPSDAVKINDCSTTNIETIKSSKLQAPISQTWGINEGQFLVDTSFSLLYKDTFDLSYNCGCDVPRISKNPRVIINNNNNLNRQALARLNNENPLRGFTFPKTICFNK